MTTDSDEECNLAYMLDGDDEDDEEDEDYVPGKGAEVDPDYGSSKKKKKTPLKPRYVPGQRNRAYSGSKRAASKSDNGYSDDLEVLEIPDEDEDEDSRSPPPPAKVKKSPTKPKTSPAPKSKNKSPKMKSPKAKKPRLQKNSCSDDAELAESLSVRRSSRGSRGRAVSYADADLSEEDMFEDEDLLEAFRRSKAEAAEAEKKKQRADDLWSKFKTDMADKEKKKPPPKMAATSPPSKIAASPPPKMAATLPPSKMVSRPPPKMAATPPPPKMVATVKPMSKTENVNNIKLKSEKLAESSGDGLRQIRMETLESGVKVPSAKPMERTLQQGPLRIADVKKDVPLTVLTNEMEKQDSITADKIQQEKADGEASPSYPNKTLSVNNKVEQHTDQKKFEQHTDQKKVEQITDQKKIEQIIDQKNVEQITDQNQKQGEKMQVDVSSANDSKTDKLISVSEKGVKESEQEKGVKESEQEKGVKESEQEKGVKESEQEKGVKESEQEKGVKESEQKECVSPSGKEEGEVKSEKGSIDIMLSNGSEVKEVKTQCSKHESGGTDKVNQSINGTENVSTGNESKEQKEEGKESVKIEEEKCTIEEKVDTELHKAKDGVVETMAESEKLQSALGKDVKTEKDSITNKEKDVNSEKECVEKTEEKIAAGMEIDTTTTSTKKPEPSTVESDIKDSAKCATEEEKAGLSTSSGIFNAEMSISTGCSKDIGAPQGSILDKLGETFAKNNATRSSGIDNFLKSGVKKTGGLSSVLNTIEKKKKVSVLDQTKNDWDSFKSTEKLEEELKANRQAGYLDRQEFLQRVDVKQWENEREMRLFSNRK